MGGRDQEDPAAPLMFGQLSKAEMLALVKEQALSKQKKTERPVRTIQEKIKFYATFSFSLVAITGFSVLMFLVPFIVDPALATLTADFVVSKVFLLTRGGQGVEIGEIAISKGEVK